ncbi:replication initiator [Stackebrandtia soli]|uniref:replication initiator n=1 Tax=Stackebrandtia soli TaxID=1892856 RepID=UPI0039EC7D71
MLTRENREWRDLLRSSGYRAWREQVEATGGCLSPVRLSGSSTVTDRTSGNVLRHRSGHILAACGTRRASICPSCAQRYSQDAFHLVRAGITGDESKDITIDASTPRLFLTLTASSFGAVHSAGTLPGGGIRPCACRRRHALDSPMLGQAIDPETYDYMGAVIWQLNASVLWHRFTIRVRRELAMRAGIRVKDFADVARVSYVKVGEYQRRGLIHFHAVVRIDGPDGPDTPPPSWATPDVLEEAVRAAVASTEVTADRPDTGKEVALTWGQQLDVRRIDTTGTDAGVLAGYIAKYSTKSSGASNSGIDRPVRSREAIDCLPGISPHHRAMMRAAWDAGGQARRWCHMLGFPGHFLTKSKLYSVTFSRLRTARRLHRLADLLDELGRSDDDVLIVNEWAWTGTGHRSTAEYELAAAIGERQRKHQQSMRESKVESSKE